MEDEEAKAGVRPGRYHHGDLRAALLDAAERELQESGIEGFSLRAVAKRAGVSHAAPAHHFVDVKGLLTALAALGFRRLVAEQRRAMAQAGDAAAAQLPAAGLGYVRFAFANPALFRLIFSSDRPDFEDPELSAAAGEAFGMLVTEVAAATGRDEGTPPDTADVAAAWAMAHGLADLLSAGRLKALLEEPQEARDRIVLELVARAVPAKGRR